MEQYKTYKIEFKKSWNNSSNKIDTITKFQEYEYKSSVNVAILDIYIIIII